MSSPCIALAEVDHHASADCQGVDGAGHYPLLANCAVGLQQRVAGNSDEILKHLDQYARDEDVADWNGLGHAGVDIPVIHMGMPR